MTRRDERCCAARRVYKRRLRGSLPSSPEAAPRTDTDSNKYTVPFRLSRRTFPCSAGVSTARASSALPRRPFGGVSTPRDAEDSNQRPLSRHPPLRRDRSRASRLRVTPTRPRVRDGVDGVERARRGFHPSTLLRRRRREPRTCERDARERQRQIPDTFERDDAGGVNGDALNRDAGEFDVDIGGEGARNTRARNASAAMRNFVNAAGYATYAPRIVATTGGSGSTKNAEKNAEKSTENVAETRVHAHVATKRKMANDWPERSAAAATHETTRSVPASSSGRASATEKPGKSSDKGRRSTANGTSSSIVSVSAGFPSRSSRLALVSDRLASIVVSVSIVSVSIARLDRPRSSPSRSSPSRSSPSRSAPSRSASSRSASSRSSEPRGCSSPWRASACRAGASRWRRPEPESSRGCRGG